MNTKTMRGRGGFSLIEVLVSVVVMSFGLLSLAALQGTLFKASDSMNEAGNRLIGG